MMKRKRNLCWLLICVALTGSLWNMSKLNETLRRMYRPSSEVLSEVSTRHGPDTKGYKDPKLHYADVQILIDNSTIVYAGYYDNREAQNVVKIPSVVDMEKKIHNFTCNLVYPDGNTRKVYAKVELISFSWFNNGAIRERTAIIICPVMGTLGPPSSVRLAIAGRDQVTTTIPVKPRAPKTNNLTRCVKQFCNSYSDDKQLVWNIEFYRILGVDKQIFYLSNQTTKIKDILKSYEKEGVVELRNFDIPKLSHKPPELRFQHMVLQGCLLSEMHTAKYILFTDVDEIIFPRVHRNIVEMADFLFDFGGKRIGSLNFKQVFYSLNSNITDVHFPDKDIAKEYNIDPLLHTQRYKTAQEKKSSPKTLVKPMSVKVMFVHIVETFFNGYKELFVDDDIGVVNHYRKGFKLFLQPPIFANTEALRFSKNLTSAVRAKYEAYFQK